MQRAAASEIPPVLKGLPCGGGVEGHQPPMQLFAGGGNILLRLLWILKSKHCLLLLQAGVRFQRTGCALSLFSWPRGGAGCALSGAALRKWLQKAGAAARALLLLGNLCFLCSPW